MIEKSTIISLSHIAWLRQNLTLMCFMSNHKACDSILCMCECHTKEKESLPT